MAISHHLYHGLLVRNKSQVPPTLNYTGHGYWKVEGGDIFGSHLKAYPPQPPLRTSNILKINIAKNSHVSLYV